MNTILILLLLLVIFYFLSTNNSKQEFFVQTKSDKNPNKNAKMVKPIQVSPNYVPPTKTYERDDWVNNPKNTPKIASNLINPSDDLPGTGNNNFEQQSLKNKVLLSPKIIYPETKQENETQTNANFKKLRPESGHLIRPIELDSTPDSNTTVERPYVTGETPQPNSEYLDYANIPVPNSPNYEVDIYQENEQVKNISNAPELVINTNINDKKSLSNIAKKLIKKAAQLSVVSTQSDDPIMSVQKANYAIGYLDALQDIMTDAEITNLVDIDLNKFRRELNKVQSHNISSVKLRCPSLSSDKKYLLEIATKL
jgi:hypothetical protein